SCVFKEPQFSDRVVKAVVDQTSAQIGTLDPLGAEIDSGPEMYFTLLSNVANSLHSCLSK
ncbi:MAG: zinc ABC transporter substrate-binding protein, partial [Pseudomonadota bacterium]|nr:zinc ABC transporter substrate-binding protein [Pseudomonadota bacterium]